MFFRSLFTLSLILLHNVAFTNEANKSKVIDTNGLVDFWDFEKSDQQAWQSYYDSNVMEKSFPIYLRQIGDPNRYSSTNWPYNIDKKSKFTIDQSGPFKNAVRFNLGYIYGEIPRIEFDKSALDLSGNKPFTMIAWANFKGNRHLVAGIWDEGGWNKYAGRRQAALFAGLFNQKGVIAHVSSTGAASFPQSNVDGAQYARLRAIDGQEFFNNEWVAVAMTFDPEANIVKAYLNGKMTEYIVPDPVTEDVMQHDKIPPANPFVHHFPLYAPDAFQIKFNGYEFHNALIKEHRLWIDLKNKTITYDQEGSDNTQKFRIHFDIIRDGLSILDAPIITDVHPNKSLLIPAKKPMLTDDLIMVRLEENLNNQWQQVGSTIERQIMEGAPFTFGRALGLDEDSVDHGSEELYLDGVAVFNRVLNSNELNALSFIK